MHYMHRTGCIRFAAMRMIVAVVLVLQAGACSRPTPETVKDTVPPAPLLVHAADTALLYRTTIADYLAEFDHRPETLYIGRHVDFPPIVLPDSIGGTVVRLMDPTEAVAVQDREQFAYVNIFGDLLPASAEFFVVRFNSGMRHHRDGRDDRHLFYSLEGARVMLDSVTHSRE